MYAFICVYVCIYMYVHVYTDPGKITQVRHDIIKCSYIYIYIYVYIYLYTHIYIHTFHMLVYESGKKCVHARVVQVQTL